MKLTKEHIGKKVRYTPAAGGSFLGILTSLDGNNIYLDGHDGYRQEGELGVTGTWELVDEGLSLLEAMQSGKDFREIGAADCDYMRAVNSILFWVDTLPTALGTGRAIFITVDRLAARYELMPEPKKVEVTAEMIDRAATLWWTSDQDSSAQSLIATPKKELGL